MEFLLKKIEKEIKKLNNQNYLEALNTIEERYRNKDFKIAVVGEFSSGKSTLINSLIGDDVLVHATIETTATITNIHNNETKSKKIYVKYVNGEKKEVNGFDEIKSLTTTSSHIDVANEIESVDIYTNFIKQNKNIVIVDTPGLNGVADNHRERTIEEVKNSHACIFVFQKNGMTESDIEFIKLLMKYNNRFIFVLNFIDELRLSEGENVENKIASLNESIGKVTNDNKLNIRYEVVGVSALKALASKDKKIKRLYDTDIFELTNKKRKDIYKESKVEDLENAIIKLIEDDKKNNVKKKQAIYLLKSLISTILERESGFEEIRKEAISGDISYKNIQQAKKRKEKIEEIKGRIGQSIDGLVISEIRRLKGVTENNIEENLSEIYNDMQTIIEKEKDYDNFEKKYEKKYFNNQLKVRVDKYVGELENLEFALIKEIHIKAFHRLKEYVKKGKIQELREIKFVNVKNENIILKINDKQKKILKIESDLNNFKAVVKSEEINKKLKEKEVKECEKKLQNIFNKEKNMDIMAQQRILSLGNEPKHEIRYRTETSYEQRSGVIGKLWEILAGPKEVTREVAYEDSTKANEWRRKRGNLERNIAIEKRVLNKEILDLKKEKNFFVSKLEKSTLEKENGERKVRTLENQIKFKKDELQQYETIAKKEYLGVRKKDLLKEVYKYLLSEDKKYKSARNLLVDKIIKDFDNQEKRIKKEFGIEVKRIIDEEEKYLEGIINGNVQELNEAYKSNEGILNQLSIIFEDLKIEGNYE